MIFIHALVASVSQYLAAACVYFAINSYIGDHELRAVKDPSPRPVSEVHNQFTQTGDDDTALEVAHRSGKQDHTCA